MDKQKILKITSIIIGVFIGILILVIGFMVIQRTFTRAEDQSPQNVTTAEITQNSAKVNWTTAVENQGVIEYGTSITALNFFAPESQSTKTHLVELTLLSPNTTYYFQIRIGDKKYDNNGVPYTFATKGEAVQPTQPVLSSPTPATSSASPTPISSVQIPDNSSQASCTVTDCAAICKKLGSGCTTQDLLKNKCIGKVNVSTCEAVTPTP